MAICSTPYRLLSLVPPAVTFSTPEARCGMEVHSVKLGRASSLSLEVAATQHREVGV